jgi:hypothetical protein
MAESGCQAASWMPSWPSLAAADRRRTGDRDRIQRLARCRCGATRARAAGFHALLGGGHRCRAGAAGAGAASIATGADSIA